MFRVHEKDRKEERKQLLQGVHLPPLRSVSEAPLPPARQRPTSPKAHGLDSISYDEPKNQAGEAKVRTRGKYKRHFQTVPSEITRPPAAAATCAAITSTGGHPSTICKAPSKKGGLSATIGLAPPTVAIQPSPTGTIGTVSAGFGTPYTSVSGPASGGFIVPSRDTVGPPSSVPYAPSNIVGDPPYEGRLVPPLRVTQQPSAALGAPPSTITSLPSATFHAPSTMEGGVAYTGLLAQTTGFGQTTYSASQASPNILSGLSSADTVVPSTMGVQSPFSEYTSTYGHPSILGASYATNVTSSAALGTPSASGSGPPSWEGVHNQPMPGQAIYSEPKTKSSRWYHFHQQMADLERKEGEPPKKRYKKHKDTYSCGICGQPKNVSTNHRKYKKKSFCPNNPEGLSFEDWKKNIM